MNEQARHYLQGEHICALYDRAEDQRVAAAAYIAEGLRCRERCLYVAGSSKDLADFRAEVTTCGIDAGAAIAERALVVQTNADTHLLNGYFDSERMLRMLNDAVEAALNDGFTGLRTCGDMSWLLGEPAGSDRIVEYEALLNSFFRNVRALGMCQYDLGRLPPALLDHALATHSTATIDGGHVANQFYRPPAVSNLRTPQPDDVHWKITELRRSAHRT